MFQMQRTISVPLLLLLVTIPIFSQERVVQNNQLIGVSSAHPLATQAGIKILNQGGNAFDAAIAIASTLNVVEPMMSGIGGYGTILIYDAKKQKVRFLNCSGRFPIKTNTDLMRLPTPDYRENRVGPKSISTPGNLNAWAALHKEYGKTAWNQLFKDAIYHAEKGFILTDMGGKMINYSAKNFSPYAKSFYCKEDKPLAKGDTLIQADLAKTFTRIAKEGVAPFYSGDIAKAIDKQMKEVGSFLSFEDLKTNVAEWYEPIKFNYNGFDVYTAAPPANSFAAFVNLGLMQEFSNEKLTHNSTDYVHLFAEITKESYKARLAYSFDPEIREVPLDSILAQRAIKKQAQKINRTKASVFQPPFSGNSTNTTHFVVADQWGNVVSATQTLGNLFGSRVMVEGTGVWLNNSMAYSTFEPKGNPMDAFPGRHKLSGDCPVIILKAKEPWAALGTPGGHTITQNVPQIIFNLIDFGMSMQQAIDASKIAFVEPDILAVEDDLPLKTIEGLKARGHNLDVGPSDIGNAHGIKIIRDKKGRILSFDVGTDKRGDGKALVPVVK
jgi:gamma-glutamyltranspeptidase / glutathione hydrolase